MDYQAEWERIHSVLFNYFQCGGVLYEEVMPDLLGRPLIEGVPAIAKKYFELKKQVEHYKKIAEARQGEFNELRKRLKVPESEWVTPYVRDALDELDRAKRALKRAGFVDNGAQEWKPPVGWGKTGYLSERLREATEKLAKSQVDCDKYKAEWKAAQTTFEETYAAYTEANRRANERESELTALRQRDAAPVKVRFSCTAKELANVMRGRVRFEDCAQEAMDYLAAHAVIDAPAGVPSVDELVTIGTAAWHKAGGSDPAFMPVPDPGDYAYATAIRDAVLAGVGTTYKRNPANDGFVDIPTPAGVPSVDELAKVAANADDRQLEDLDKSEKACYMDVAAAIRDAVLAGVAGEKTEPDYSISACYFPRTGNAELTWEENSTGKKCAITVPVTAEQGNQLADTVGACVYWTAAPTPPPTAEQVEALARVLREGVTCPVCSGHTNDDDRGCCCERTLASAAFAHIGRVPLGAELDVHPDQLELYKWVTMPDGGYTYAAQQAIDLCRSRIKPVYECKECAKRPKNVVTSFNFTFNYDTGTWQVVNRAALEGE